VIVFYNVVYSYSTLLSKFALDLGIILRYSANYYPRGNGVVESTNKNLILDYKKDCFKNHKNWHNAFSNALCADRVTPKKALGTSPYYLVYGQKVILPTNIYLPSLRLSQASKDQPDFVLQKRIDTLLMLEEQREKGQTKFCGTSTSSEMLV
jgi:hypothetical protein